MDLNELNEEEMKGYAPKPIFVDERNRQTELRKEEGGQAKLATAI